MVPSRDQWQEELQAVLSSAAFARARQAKRLLTWLVTQLLDDRAGLLNEYDVALHVFHRRDHDPTSDAHIRKQISRLRARLASFYADEGSIRPYEMRIHGFTPQLTSVARTARDWPNLVSVLSFEAGVPELAPLALRLTNELMHLLSQRRKVQCGGTPRPLHQARVVLSGSLWKNDASGFLVFARTTSDLGVVLNSVRVLHPDPAAWDTCADSILDYLFREG